MQQIFEIFQNLKSLGAARLTAMGLAAAGIVAALLIGLSFAVTPHYRPISTDATAAEAASLVAALEQAGFKPKLSGDGTLISLPEGDIARARMALAEAGMPAAGNAGWEIFDNASGIGMNSFLQRVNRLRALEGELARSIQTIDAVEVARVHLVLPERETFSQERPEPTASVIIRARRGAPVERRQALAIRNLIAAAVPGLSPERVTVLSASGDTILSDDDVGPGVSIATARASLEDRLARNVESILSARVGAGNVRVRVSATLATAREVVVTESFNPDEQVARRTNALSEQSNGQDGAQNNVDVANNMPGVNAGAGAGGGRTESTSKTQDIIDFEIGSTRSERVTEAGAVNRLTVAVIVNGVRDESGAYSDRTQQELDQFASLARSAVGIDDDRGDVVTVASLQFIDDASLEDQTGTGGLGELMSRNFGTIVQGVMALVAIALLLVLGLRPILKRATPEADAALGGQNAQNGSTTRPQDAQGAVGAKGGASEGGDDTGADGQEIAPESEYVSISSVSGDLMRRRVAELSDLVDTNKDESLRVLRSWINQKA